MTTVTQKLPGKIKRLEEEFGSDNRFVIMLKQQLQDPGVSVQALYRRQLISFSPRTPDQCLPEVWIDDASQEAEALELLRHLRHVPQRRWRCSCGERVVGGFEQCWNCGAMMPSE